MQHFEKFVFFEPKNVLFVGKKLDFFPKTRKVANLLYNAYQMILYLKKFFSALIVRFFARNQKVCEVGEIREYDEERVYFQKNCFDLFESPLYKNGKTENMPVGAGGSVYSVASTGLSGRHSGFKYDQVFRFNLHLIFPCFKLLPFKASKVFNFLNVSKFGRFYFSSVLNFC